LHFAFYNLHLILPAHAISTKNKHLLVIYSIPTRGFTAVLSVFKGTPPKKPLDSKCCWSVLDGVCGQAWVEPTGEDSCLLVFNLVLATSGVI